MIFRVRAFRLPLMAGLFLFAGLFLVSKTCLAQIHSPAIAKDTVYKHALSFGPSLGTIMERDAWFWGLSAGYAYQLNGPWALSPSLGYDKEIEQKTTGEGIVNSFTVMGTISYFITEKLSFTTGLAKGFIDDDNRDKVLRLNNGDWSTGLAMGYNLPDLRFWERGTYGLSVSCEYNINKNEFNLSLELNVGLAF